MRQPSTDQGGLEVDWRCQWAKANDGECSRCRHFEGNHRASKSESSHRSSDLPDKGQSTPRTRLQRKREKQPRKTGTWSARTDRMVCQWEEEKNTRRSVWTAGVRKAVRKGTGQFVVKSTRERATKRWRELHFERGCQARLGRRVNPQAWMQLTEEGLTGCDKARGQRHAVNNNVGSRFLTQKRAE